MTWAIRCPSTLSSRWASGSSWWLSHPCWLTSTVGLNERSSGGTTASKARSHAASPVPAGNATFTAYPAASPVPISVGNPVPGNSDALGPGGQQPPDRDGRVVVDAEPAGGAAHRVVQSARDAHGVHRGPWPDRASRRQRRAGHQGGRLVHALEDRVVRGAEPKLGVSRQGAARLPHRGHVVVVMDGLKLR